jgi:hypothetical protein
MFFNQEGQEVVKTKLEQYYSWLDGLNRQQFRNIAKFILMNGLNMYENEKEIDQYIQQQQQQLNGEAGANNHHSHSHMPTLPTNWRQVLKVFQRYSLNPLDERLYVNAGASAAGNPAMARPVTEDNRASTASINEFMSPGSPSSAATSPVRGRTPGTKIASLDSVKNIPLANLVPSLNSSVASSGAFGTVQVDHKNSRKKGSQDFADEKPKVTYTPSSWKQDAKNKKQEPTKVIFSPLFSRLFNFL